MGVELGGKGYNLVHFANAAWVMALNGKMTVGSNDAVGVFTKGAGQTITNNATNINIGDSSYGFVNKQTAGGNTFILN